MKRRILSMFLTLLMLMSVIPTNVMAEDSGTPSAQALSNVMENTNQGDGVVLRKSAAPHLDNGLPDGTVDVTIEAYTTGGVTHTTASVPTDIVMVLDMSGSMETTMASSFWTYSAVDGGRESEGRRQYSYGRFDTSGSSTKYYVNLGTESDPDYREVALVRADSRRYYYYRYYDANNTAVYVYPKLSSEYENDVSPANNYAVVQFYRGTVDPERTVYAIDALKTAVSAFIETTRLKNNEILAEGGTELHRIALVKFAQNSHYSSDILAVGDHKNGSGYNHTELVANLTTVNSSGAAALSAAVTALDPAGATAVDYGMDIADAVLDDANTGSTTRGKVVIVLTDGEPNHWDGFDADVANSAITTANHLKFSGAKVYTISMAQGSNPANTTADLNRFLHYVSSNYPYATSMSAGGTDGDPTRGYYLTPSDDSSLTTIFESIASQIEAPTIPLGSAAQIVDTMSTYFTIPEKAGSITLQTADRVKNSDGTWGWAEPIEATGLSVNVQGKVLSVKGFDYDDNYISETPRLKGSNSSYYGTKLIITINAEPDYNAIDTHESSLTDGYIPSNDGTANLLNSSAQRIAVVATPYVKANTVTYQYVDPANGQTVSYASYYRFPGADVTQSTAFPAIPGHTFSGWQAATDNVTVTDGSFTMPQGDVVFTGTFTRNVHNVTYTINGADHGAVLPTPSMGVPYGETVQIAPDLYVEGYTFHGWFSSDPTIEEAQTSFTMPDKDVLLVGYFTANSNTPYTTIHYTQNTDGTYSRAEQQPITGIGATGEYVTATVRTYEGFTRDDNITNAWVPAEGAYYDAKVDGYIAADGSLIMRVFHTRNKYTVTYAYEGSVPTGAPVPPVDTFEYYHGQTVTIRPHAEQDAFADHTFAGWHSQDGSTVAVTDDAQTFVMPIGGMTLYGNFSIATDVPFTVEHYLQNPDGTYPLTADYTDTSHGTVGTTVYASYYTRSFTGYTYDAAALGSVSQGVISENPELVLKLYYKINTYDVEYKYEGTVPAGATDPTEFNQSNVVYGVSVDVADNVTVEGYGFSGWRIESPVSSVITNGTFTMPAEKVVLVGSFTAKANTKYTVEYYWQNPNDDGYTFYEADTYYNGVTGETVYALEKEYPGLTHTVLANFEANGETYNTAASGTVAADGSLVLRLYYNRNSYNVTYHYEANAPATASPLPIPNPRSYRYGALVTVAPDAAAEHYQFIGWYNKTRNVSVTPETETFIMPAEDVNLYGDFRRIEGVPYTVEYYLKNIGSDGYTRDDSATERYANGIAGETAYAPGKIFIGYTENVDHPDRLESGTITADGKLVLKLYYDLARYTVTYQYEGTLPADRSALPPVSTVTYGSSVPVADPATAANYMFSGWDIKTPDHVSIEAGVFTMPADNVVLVGSFDANPTYYEEYWLELPNGSYEKDAEHSHFHNDMPAGEEVTAHVRTYEGYELNPDHPGSKAAGIVVADSSLILKLYYKLYDYTVTYEYEGKVPPNAPKYATLEGKHYKDSITTPVPSLEGYTFSGWTSEQVGTVPPGAGFSMPAEDVVLKGQFIADNAWYVIEHYLMNDNGDYEDVTPYIETKTGDVGDSVRATSHQPYLDMGAEIDGAQTLARGKWEGTVLASSTEPLRLKLYYSRKPAARVEYHYQNDLTQEQWQALGWPDLPRDGAEYYVGSIVTARDFTDAKPTNMTFEGWYASEPTLHVVPNGSFIMPRLSGPDYVVKLYGRWVENAPNTFTVKYFVDDVEQTQYTATHPVNTPVSVMDKLPDTADRTYSAWSTPVSATDGAAVTVNQDGTFTMTAAGEVHIKCTSSVIPAPAETYTVTYYVNGVQYRQEVYEAGQQHVILGAPNLAPGQIFSGWRAPTTVSGAIVPLYSLGDSRYGFDMPAADVVIHGSTSSISIPDDGALKIKKVVEAPDNFTGGSVYTFNIYRLEYNIKQLVHTVRVTVDPLTGEGSSGIIILPLGANYIVEEVGAHVPGYSLETVLKNEYGTVIPEGETIRVTMAFDPTEITFTNTYTALSLETNNHFGYIIGYPNGTVQPEGNITRAEVATIFFRLLTDEKRAEYWSQTNTFTDVAPEAWYNNAISTLANAGVLNGYEDNTFHPNAPITRAELVKIAMSFYGSLSANGDVFTDTGEHWASAFINAAAELGFVSGYGDGTFQPNRLVTRAEAMKIINRTLDRSPHKDHLLPNMIIWVDNMDPDAWYYAEVQEATNSHTYTDGGLHEIWAAILPVRDWAALEKVWSNAYGRGN